MMRSKYSDAREVSAREMWLHEESLRVIAIRQ